MALCLQRDVGEEVVFTVPGPDGKPIDIRIEVMAIRVPEEDYIHLKRGQVVFACTAPQEVKIARRELLEQPKKKMPQKRRGQRF